MSELTGPLLLFLSFHQQPAVYVIWHFATFHQQPAVYTGVLAPPSNAPVQAQMLLGVETPHSQQCVRAAHQLCMSVLRCNTEWQDADKPLHKHCAMKTHLKGCTAQKLSERQSLLPC